MILAKAPLRISFFGGGSDLPGYYIHRDGHVLSTTIDKYMYVAINKNNSDLIKLMYSEIEIVDDLDKIKHDIIRNTLYQQGIYKGIEIASFADIPTIGTGLGSSSTFAVALIAAMKAGQPQISKMKIAELACQIELDWCLSPIGKQDQYAAAIGGMNHFTFNRDYTTVESVGDLTKNRLNDNLILLYTGVQRSANDILKVVNKNLSLDSIERMADQAIKGVEYLKTGDLDSFGEELDIAWQYKKEMANGISNDYIDSLYDIAKQKGALGGKILGAGGGGYMLLYVPDEESKCNIINCLETHGMVHVPFRFENSGVKVVYDDVNKQL